MCCIGMGIMIGLEALNAVQQCNEVTQPLFASVGSKKI